MSKFEQMTYTMKISLTPADGNCDVNRHEWFKMVIGGVARDLLNKKLRKLFRS
jgi:hypothetical protein